MDEGKRKGDELKQVEGLKGTNLEDDSAERREHAAEAVGSGTDAGQRDAAGCALQKMVKPLRGEPIVEHLVGSYLEPVINSAPTSHLESAPAYGRMLLKAVSPENMPLARPSCERFAAGYASFGHYSGSRRIQSS